MGVTLPSSAQFGAKYVWGSIQKSKHNPVLGFLYLKSQMDSLPPSCVGFEVSPKGFITDTGFPLSTPDFPKPRDGVPHLLPLGF